MKKIFSMLGAYLIICFSGTFLGMILFFLYKQSLSFMAGTSVEISLKVFQIGVLYSLPIVLMLSPLFLTLYTIRHPISHIGNSVFWALGILTWGLFLPLSLRVFNVEKLIISQEENRSLSPGYFRKSDSHVFYLVESHTENNISTISNGSTGKKIYRINYEIKNLDKMSNMKPEVFVSDENFYSHSKFMDNIAEDVLTMPLCVQWMVKFFSLPRFIQSRIHSFRDLYFLFAFAIAILVANLFKTTSSWRLINVLTTIALNATVFYVNAIYFFNPSLFFKFFSPFFSIFPIRIDILIFINIAMAVFFVLVWFILYCIKLAKKA